MSLTHPFTIERGGRQYHLVKHPRARSRPTSEQAGEPWYIRIAVPGEKNARWKKVGEAHETEAAVMAARDLIIKARAGGNPFTQLYEATRYRATLTVGTLLDQWETAGYPESTGRKRTTAQQSRQAIALKGLRPWWAAQAVAAIDFPMLTRYATARRNTVRAGATGDRTIDLELTTLSNCFQWCRAQGLVTSNPFAGRDRFQNPDDIEHACEFMFADDEEFHRVIGALLSSADPCDVVTGAQLCFQALTGLRSGEPGHLQWNAPKDQPGHRRQGRTAEHLTVHREKGGINPAVAIHPALRDFLDCWQPYARAQWPDKPHWMFPHPKNPALPYVQPCDGNKPLAKPLHAITKLLGVPERHPHGMRAYYVRVRRSQGALDATIAGELGQGSGAREIVRCYGKFNDQTDAGDYDWMPSPESGIRPAWEILRERMTGNEMPLLSIPPRAPDTGLDTGLDTSGHVPQSPAKSQPETNQTAATAS